MTHTQVWTVELFIEEHHDRTHAEARLHTDDPNFLKGTGSARRNSLDMPDRGAELAVSRALSDLARQLLGATVADLEGLVHAPVPLNV